MMNIAMVLIELTLAVYFSISEGYRLLMSMDYSLTAIKHYTFNSPTITSTTDKLYFLGYLLVASEASPLSPLG